MKPLSIILLTVAMGLAAPGVESIPLKDKTLVVWVSPANLTQRGGSALTIDDGESHFDGIIFGEIAPRKWMPGSDFHHRTHQGQANWPEETAATNTFLQIAITYKAQQVTVYRNGQQYAQYTMANPPLAFGSPSVVVIGLRHQRKMALQSSCISWTNSESITWL